MAKKNKVIIVSASLIALAAIIALSVAIPFSLRKTKDYKASALTLLEKYPLIDGLVTVVVVVVLVIFLLF
jgi:hypothetical protein